MLVFLIVATLIGITLGLRFNIFVLVPAILLASTVITLSEIAERQSIKLIIIGSVGTVVSVQIGYLGGRLLNVAARSYSAASIAVRYRNSESQLT